VPQKCRGSPLPLDHISDDSSMFRFDHGLPTAHLGRVEEGLAPDGGVGVRLAPKHR